MAKRKRGQSRQIVIAVGVAAVVIGGLIWILNLGATPAGNDLLVVAGENPWGNIASQIGGNKAHVLSILNNPNTDPHLYESDAKDAAEVAAAKVVIKNGAGYDDFVDKLVAGSGRTAQIKQVNAQLVMNASSAGVNPHLWYKVQDVPAMADAIEQAMASADPKDQSYFSLNLGKFNTALVPINSILSDIKSKYGGEPVAYTERVAGYLLSDAGLRNVTPSGFARSIEDGSEPGPGDTAAMENLIKGHKIKALLYNTQTVSSATEQVKSLAKANHIPVVGVSETLPTGVSYQTWMLSQAKAILNALRS
jgi:zinc/manganese transport system substrate-binding protein